jgi:SAM-dependent methyltransferase
MNVDYDRISDTYDAHRNGTGPHISTIVELAANLGATRVLELGSGTGNATAAFLAGHAAELLAIEPSAGMIARATRKALPAHFVRARAETLPVRTASVDFVYGAYMLHYVADLDALAAECRRVLRRGAAAFATSPRDFIVRHPMTRYFRSFAAIDLARFPATEEVMRALTDAGFAESRKRRVFGEPLALDERYVGRVRSRHISTFELIPDDEYQAGLERLTRDVAAGVAGEAFRWEGEVIWGTVR